MSHASVLRRGTPEKKPGRSERQPITPRDPQLPERSRDLAHEHWALGEDRPLLPSLLKMMAMSGAPLVQRKTEAGGAAGALESWMDYETRPLEFSGVGLGGVPGLRHEARGGQSALRPVQREAEGAPQVEGELVQRAADLGTQGGASEIPFRAEMEQAFGADFSGVKSFTGGTASVANQALGAKAYTMGDAVVFRDSSPDKQTVGHELTHVLQQRAGKVATPQGKGGIINTDSSLEAEADRAGDAVARGESVQRADSSAAGGAPVSVVQRAVDGRNPDVSWETIHRLMWPDAPAYVKRQPDKDKDNNKLGKKKRRSDVPTKPKPGPQDLSSPDQKPPRIKPPQPVLEKLVLPRILSSDAARIARLFKGYKDIYLNQWIKKEQQLELRDFYKEAGDVDGSLKRFRKLAVTLRRKKAPHKDARLRQAFMAQKANLEGHVREALKVEQTLGARRQLAVVEDVTTGYKQNRGKIPSVVRAIEKQLRTQYKLLGELVKKHSLRGPEALVLRILSKTIQHGHRLHGALSKSFHLYHNWKTVDHLSPDPIQTGGGRAPGKKPVRHKNVKQIGPRPRWR